MATGRGLSFFSHKEGISLEINIDSPGYLINENHSLRAARVSILLPSPVSWSQDTLDNIRM